MKAFVAYQHTFGHGIRVSSFKTAYNMIEVTALKKNLTKLEFSTPKYNWKIQLKVPEWAFEPDQWSEVFWDSLIPLALNWKNKRIWEVGVGTGINLMMLRKLVEATWYFSDYDARCVPLAIENLNRGANAVDIYKRVASRGEHNYNPKSWEQLHLRPDLGELCPLTGSWDLVSPPKQGGDTVPTVDIIFGCLPQVPAEIDLGLGDRIAHYYDPNRYPKAHFNALGLGLVETLLVEAKSVLAPKGEVILNLSGRPGLKRLRSLFRKTGYNPEVIEREVIEQHVGTSLASLATLEENGHEDFEFFYDSDCRIPLDAREAELRRLAGEEVYHYIYVMKGTLA